MVRKRGSPCRAVLWKGYQGSGGRLFSKNVIILNFLGSVRHLGISDLSVLSKRILGNRV